MAARPFDATHDDDPLSWRTELSVRPRWVVPALVVSGLLVAALLAAAAVGTWPRTEDRARDAQRVADEARGALDAALALAAEDARAPAPTGSDVAVARWCLRDGAATCAAAGRSMSAERAAQVMRQVDAAGRSDLRRELEEAELALAATTRDAASSRVDWLESASMMLPAALAGFGAACWFASRALTRRWRVRVRAHELSLDERSIPATEIVGCRVHGTGLVVLLLGGGRFETGPLIASSEQLDEVAERVRGIALSPDRRRQEARARVALEAERSRLVARALRG